MARTTKVSFTLTRTVTIELSQGDGRATIAAAIESVIDDCPAKASWPELKAFRDADGNIDDIIGPMTHGQECAVLDILYPVDMSKGQFHDMCYVVIGEVDDGPPMDKKVELALREYVKQNLTAYMLPIIATHKAEMEGRKRDEQERDAESRQRRLDDAMKVVRAAGFIIATDQNKKSKSKKA